MRILFILLILVSISCEDFVQVDLPNSQLTSQIVFANDETAIAASMAMYNAMLASGSFIGHLFNPISYLGGLSSDELDDYTGLQWYLEFKNNEINPGNATLLSAWNNTYNIIYEANAIIEGVGTSVNLSQDIKRQLEGEARFVRAFCNFYLVNLFGDIPLAVTTDYRINAVLKRTSVTDVYNYIKTDLVKAKSLLGEEYFGQYRVRPNRWSAAALLSRVYLYTDEYAKAETEASEVIANPIYRLEEDLNNVFIANSKETILALSQVAPGSRPTADGQTFYISSEGPEKALCQELLSSFEGEDKRRVDWISTRDVNLVTYYRPYKYKVRSHFTDDDYPENLSLLRLAELFLIRAEARAEQEKIEGAQDDLNVIRHRAGLSDTDAADQPSLRSAIEQERRHELFCEMGHRWLDLKRTKRAGAILAGIKPFWHSSDVLYPIPEQATINNPNLNPQNDGY